MAITELRSLLFSLPLGLLRSGTGSPVAGERCQRITAEEGLGNWHSAPPGESPDDAGGAGGNLAAVGQYPP